MLFAGPEEVAIDCVSVAKASPILEVIMGSSSSSYAPKTIYLDVDGKVQRVSLKISNIKAVCLRFHQNEMHFNCKCNC